jgi:hypothetical protein
MRVFSYRHQPKETPRNKEQRRMNNASASTQTPRQYARAHEGGRMTHADASTHTHTHTREMINADRRLCASPSVRQSGCLSQCVARCSLRAWLVSWIQHSSITGPFATVDARATPLGPPPGTLVPLSEGPHVYASPGPPIASFGSAAHHPHAPARTRAHTHTTRSTHANTHVHGHTHKQTHKHKHKHNDKHT